MSSDRCQQEREREREKERERERMVGGHRPPVLRCRGRRADAGVKGHHRRRHHHHHHDRHAAAGGGSCRLNGVNHRSGLLCQVRSVINNVFMRRLYKHAALFRVSLDRMQSSWNTHSNLSVRRVLLDSRLVLSLPPFSRLFSYLTNAFVFVDYFC